MIQTSLLVFGASFIPTIGALYALNLHAFDKPPETPFHFRVKKALQPILDKFGLKEGLIFSEKHESNHAIGTNLGGGASIEITPGLYDFDPNLCKFILKHEIAHIKNNDIIKSILVNGITTLAITIFSNSKGLGFFKSLLIGHLVGGIAKSLFSIYCEGRADDFAIENARDAELLARRRERIAHIRMHQSLQKKHPLFKLLFSSSGNDRFNFSHPSETSRLEKVEKAIQQRQIVTNPEKEIKRIKKMQDFLLEQPSYSEIQRALNLQKIKETSA